MALENCDKEPVGAVLRRGQPKIAIAARHGTADRLFPNLPGGNDGKFGGGREKGFGLCFVLLAQQRAGRVYEAAARADEARGAAQDVLLAANQIGEIRFGDAPFVTGVAAPGSDAEAGRVDQNPVEAAGVALDPFVALAGQRAPLDIADPAAAQPARRLIESMG